MIQQLALTDAVGSTFSDLMQDWAFGPIGMASSTFEQPLSGAREKLAARGHRCSGRPGPERSAGMGPRHGGRAGVQGPGARRGEAGVAGAQVPTLVIDAILHIDPGAAVLPAGGPCCGYYG